MDKGKRAESLDPSTEIPEAFWSDLDPDRSMSEREDYWRDLPPPEPPTRLAWLRHRLREAARLLGAPPPDPWQEARPTHADWTRLSEQALGPLLKPGDYADRRQARSAAPNAREPAREPAAHSPAIGGANTGEDEPQAAGAASKKPTKQAIRA